MRPRGSGSFGDSTKVKVAAVQWEHRQLRRFEDFAERVSVLLDRAAEARVVVFGELFTISLLTLLPEWQTMQASDFGRLADLSDDYVRVFTAEARRRDQVIVAGSHLTGTTAHNENVAHVFLPDGSIRVHAKTHLFPLEFASRTVEGDSFGVVDVGGLKIGIAVCYEAEIPEVSTILARRGAELIVCPSYTVTPAGFWRVRHCAQARCVENQVFFVHCSTVGRIGGPILDGFGRSSILSPCDTGFPADGVLVEAEPDVEDVIEAELDLAQLREDRRTGAAPTYQDRLRRTPLYRAAIHDLLPGVEPRMSEAD